MSDNKLPFEEFIKLTGKQRGIAYKYMSDHDKFRAGITEIIESLILLKKKEKRY